MIKRALEVIHGSAVWTTRLVVAAIIAFAETPAIRRPAAWLRRPANTVLALRAFVVIVTALLITAGAKLPGSSSSGHWWG
jgi:hypothetical protein